MLNNIRVSLPQLGVSQADIIYEAPAEGGITRMLAVFQDVDGVGEIGSVRSSRPYYLELALGLDAVYLHAGGSEAAYDDIQAWNVTALDCVRGPYEGTLFWRDPERRKNMGFEHSVLTSGDTISSLLPTYGIRLDHEDDYSYPQTFTETGTPSDGEAATSITVPFSSYKTGIFTYDAQSRTYQVDEYGAAYVDGDTGAQVEVTNVLVLKTDCHIIPGDDKGRLSVTLTGSGDGWFACGGKLIPIHWSKADRNAPLIYTTEDRSPLSLGAGRSYVNIIPLENNISWS
jgi:hypothetical protein